MLIPAVISFAYVVPFLPERKRLRDLPYIKVVFIAFAWAWVTVLIPAATMQQYGWSTSIWFMFAERFCFVFAIAVTFDIRDVLIDKDLRVKTIPPFSESKLLKYLQSQCYL